MSSVHQESRPTTLVTSRPPCRKVTSLRDGHSTPPTDSLLRFLVESSCDDYPTCANCDRNEKTPMFFCNTCGKVFLLFNKKRGCCVFAPPSLNKFLCNISGNKLFSVKWPWRPPNVHPPNLKRCCSFNISIKLNMKSQSKFSTIGCLACPMREIFHSPGHLMPLWEGDGKNKIQDSGISP